MICNAYLRNTDTSPLPVDRTSLTKHYTALPYSLTKNPKYININGLLLLYEHGIYHCCTDKKRLNRLFIFRPYTQMSGNAFKCHHIKCYSILVLRHRARYHWQLSQILTLEVYMLFLGWNKCIKGNKCVLRPCVEWSLC